MAKTALISVSDKEGIAEFAKSLSSLGFDIISTGNTAKVILQGKVKVTQVSDVTGFPEMLSGRVKTLHPKVFGGILADRSDKKHNSEVKSAKIGFIDLVVVNFYPFEKISVLDARLNEIIENIDIGGPSLVRAAAKNYKDVLVVVDPKDYGVLIEKIKNKSVDEDFRGKLAAKAFMHTARYDTIISRYFAKSLLHEDFPDTYNFTFKKIQDLRYGENPHQKAAFYRAYLASESCISTAKQLQGKELSYNNILDSNDAFELIKEFEKPTAAVIKHTNPSGVASAQSIEEAFKKAYETDPKSAFGCVVALNKPCNEAVAKIMKPLFVEVVICPKFEKGATDVLREKKNLRLIETGPITKDYSSPEMRG